MDLRRLRHGEWIAGVSGATLLVALFLDWYKLSGPGIWPAANAWESFAVVDVFLAIAALAGIALALTAATQRSPAVPQAVGALTVPVAFIAAILVVLRALDPPSWESVVGGPPVRRHLDLPVTREAGLYIGVVATLGVLVGAWRSIGDQSFPRAVAPKVDVTPLPAPKPRSEPHDDE